jgi:HIV Tat-specific factor 1
MRSALLASLKQQMGSIKKHKLAQKPTKKIVKTREKRKQKWYQPRLNTYVYVQGLPPEITVEACA